MQMSEVESVLEKLSSVPSQMPSDPQAAKSAYAEVCQIVQRAGHCILHLQRALARYKAEEAHKNRTTRTAGRGHKLANVPGV